MRILYFLVFSILFVSCSTAQQGYSTTNKKAIVLFEEGQKAPSLTRNPLNGQPNYKEGLRLMEKALEKDPNFWEAHVVAAEFAEYCSGHSGHSIES